MNMGDRIKELRLYHGMTQEELGQKIGVQKSAIRKYEKGEVINIKRSTIETLSRIFNVSPSYLMCLDDASTNTKEDRLDTKAIEVVKVPVLGKISAGVPILAEESFEGYALAPTTQIKSDKEYFYLKVQGDSMNLKFSEGSIVLVEKTEILENGDIGIVAVNGYEATIKKYRREGNLVILEPMSTNPQHTVQIYDVSKVPIHVLGKAISYQGIV